MKHRQQLPVAIVGMAGRFPQAGTLNDYWDIIRNGKDAVTRVPSSRWDAKKLFHEDVNAVGKIVNTVGGFIGDVDRFDAHFFSLTDDEAKSIDPQQRIMLRLAWEALEHARIKPSSLEKTQTGVFVGACSWDYNKLSNRDTQILDKYIGPGTGMGVIANRISYFLKTQGPSQVIDTACSSSLVAIHSACQSLAAGDCDIALAGGVNLVLTPETSITFSAAGLLSKQGHCKTFSSEADGYVRSEGAGLVVLKNLGDALRDGDRVLGIIRGSSTSHNGTSNGLTAPNGPAQQQVVSKAIEKSGVAKHKISFAEVHGTGTTMGDTIEVNALHQVLAANSASKKTPHPCNLSAVKANIGHTEAASGIAGLIKIILCFQYKKLPPQLFSESINPSIQRILDKGNFYINKELAEWQTDNDEYYALLSAFGFGGANAALLVEAGDNTLPDPFSMIANNRATISDKSASAKPSPLIATIKEEFKPPFYWLKLSAKSDAALKRLANAYANTIEEGNNSLNDFCMSVNRSRDDFDYREVIIAQSKKCLLKQLRTIEQQTFEKSKNKIRTFLSFPHQVNWSPFEGQQLYDNDSVFRESIDRWDAALNKNIKLLLPLHELMFNESRTAMIPASLSPIVNACFQYTVAKSCLSWGIKPDCLKGEGLGRLVALCVADALSIEEVVGLLLSINSLEKSSEACEKVREQHTAHGATQSHASSGTKDDLEKASRQLLESVTALYRKQCSFLSRKKQSSSQPLSHRILMNDDDGFLTEDNFQSIISYLLSEGSIKKYLSKKQFTIKIDCSFEDALLQHYISLQEKNTCFNGSAKHDDGMKLWIRNLSDAYRLGINIHWQDLFGHASIIDVPHYVFDESSYWLTANSSPVIICSTPDSQMEYPVGPIDFNQS